MSPHETLFRLEATQALERAVVDHTPLCRFTIWDFPGDYYGGERTNSNNGLREKLGSDYSDDDRTYVSLGVSAAALGNLQPGGGVFVWAA